MGRITIVLLCVWGAAAVSADRASAEDRNRSAIRIDFARLHADDEIRLSGESTQKTLVFELDQRWNSLAGSVLQLQLRHSGSLDPARSFLSISINYGIVRTIPLTPQNASTTRFAIPIPPSLLRQHNEIRFMVEQYAHAGATPADLWTVVDTSSFIDVAGVRLPPKLDLAALPDALVDPLGDGRLAVLRPRVAAASTVEATALVVAQLAKGLRPFVPSVSITSTSAVRDPLLVVGTREEQPALKTFVAPGSSSAGVVGLAVRANGGRVLVTTGPDAGAVRAAASAVLGRKPLAGSIALVPQEPNERLAEPRTWVGYMPPATGFTLAGMTDGNLRIPLDSTPLNVPLRTTPDTQFFGFGHRVRLRVSVNRTYFSPQARLRVGWNGKRIAEYTADVLGSVSALPEIWIPSEQLQRQNALTLQWMHPLPADTGAAGAWLLSDTEFYFPRYYRAELPDLALLRERAYPLSTRADMSDVVIVVPDRMSDAVFGALMDLAAALGRLAPGDTVGFHVAPASAVTDRMRTQSHLIVLHSQESPLTITSELQRTRRLLWSGADRRGPVIQETISPWDTDHVVLTLTAKTDADLRWLVSTVFDARMLERLNGDAAYITPTGPVSHVVTAARPIGTFSIVTASEAWLRTHWAALPVILMFTSGLFFIACRLALRARPN